MDNTVAVNKLAAMVLESESRAAKVARLLHNEAGQTLTALGFHLQALGHDLAITNELRGHLESVMENLRFACNSLQSNTVERSGLPLALEHLASRLASEAGFMVHIRTNNYRRVDADTGHAIFRIVELALDNVRLHAGTNSAIVAVESFAEELAVTVSDSGCGFLNHQPGTGLILMHRYADNLRLQLRIDSSPGKGTIVRIKTFK